MPEASKFSREQAEKQEHDRQVLALLALAFLAEFFDKLQAAPRALPVVAQPGPNGGVGVSFERQLKDAFEDLRRVLVQSGIAAFQRARVRLVMGLMARAERQPTLRAILADRLPTLVEESSALPLHVAQELQLRYTAMAGDMVETLYNFVIARVADQSPATEKVIRDALSAMGMLGDKRFIRSLVDKFTHDAYTDGLFFAASEGLVGEVLQGFEYVSMRDDRVRPRHREEDGTFARPWDTELLAEFRKLFADWGCRCTPVAIFGVPGEPIQLV